MQGKFFYTAGFTILRELTATDLKGSLLQLLYNRVNAKWKTAFFYESRQ